MCNVNKLILQSWNLGNLNSLKMYNKNSRLVQKIIVIYWFQFLNENCEGYKNKLQLNLLTIYSKDVLLTLQMKPQCMW